MYAVIETGGKQYRVEVGTELAVELLDVEPGQEITLDRILLVADGDEAAIGRPVVEGATVAATVVRMDRAEKVISFKYRPKARSRVKKGHRQEQTILRITDVTLNGKSAAATAAAVDAARKTEREKLAEAAAEAAARDAALAATLADKAAENASAEAPKGAAAKGADKGAAAKGADKGAAAKGADKGAAAKAAAAKAPDKPARARAAKPAASAAPEAKPAPKRTRTPKKED